MSTSGDLPVVERVNTLQHWALKYHGERIIKSDKIVDLTSVAVMQKAEHSNFITNH